MLKIFLLFYIEPTDQSGRFSLEARTNQSDAEQESDHEETATVIYSGVGTDTETSAKSAPPENGISISIQQEGSVAADGSALTDEYRRPDSGIL